VYRNETVWALIAFYALRDVLTAVSIVVMAPMYPGARFNPDAARWFAGFARGMWSSKVSGTAENQLDDYLIGTIGGTGMLGAYSIAWRLTNAYTTVFQTAITKGILPTFSRLKGHERESREGMEFLLRVQSYAVVPLYVFVSLNATDIVVLTFGGHWETAGSVLRILAIAGILYPIVNTMRQYYYSVGRTSIILRVNVLILIGMLVTIPVGVVWYGAVGGAIAMNLVEITALVTFVVGLRSDLGVSIRETFAPALLGGFVTVGAVLGLAATTTWLGDPGPLASLEPLHRQLVTIAVSGTAIVVSFYGTLALAANSTVANDVSVVVEAIAGIDEE
jgi:O-antigen/teichoic acid export membrane protein